MYDEIIKMYEDGKEVAEIVVELNVTYKRVMKAIKSYEKTRGDNK